MGKHLEINGQSDSPSYYPRHADYSAYNEEMTVSKLQQDVIELIQSGKMENWHLAGCILSLASQHLDDVTSTETLEKTLETKYRNEENSMEYPGDSLEEWMSILHDEWLDECRSVPYPGYWLKIVREESHLQDHHDVSDIVLKSIYEKQKTLYDEAVREYIEDLPEQTIVVDYN
jgi:hypothetical protein